MLTTRRLSCFAPIPDADLAALARGEALGARRQEVAVGRRRAERDREVRVAREDLRRARLGVAGIPHAERQVLRALREERSTSRNPREAGHDVARDARRREFLLPANGVPDADRVVARPRRDRAPVGRECAVDDVERVALEPRRLDEGRFVSAPKSRRAVARAAQDEIGRRAHAIARGGVRADQRAAVGIVRRDGAVDPGGDQGASCRHGDAHETAALHR
mmetsp:Transcript_12636/g.50764  ORF Transcript_12636/g.50764 Transcript_12636/m.50764 type:complete len:220 (-) Transcript_12636:142-801(-)